MLEEHCIRYCSPTLASLKTGSIFSCPYTSKENLLPIIRTLNKKVQHKGLRVIPLRYGKKQAIIYVYRPNQLEEDLKQPIAHTLLQKCGYCCKNSNCCIQQLVLRLKDYKDFPHEIGLFLGYPPEDVKGFIDNKKVILLKPTTYMNLSGESIREVINFYKISNEEIIVLYDDISLEVGRLRIREKGSHGGHNGIKSIIANLGTDVFPRVKIGVGAPKGNLVSHVLGKFDNEEVEILKETIKASSEATSIIIKSDIKSAMNKLNGFNACK